MERILPPCFRMDSCSNQQTSSPNADLIRRGSWQQGNINGEFWKGSVAEIRVYERVLTDRERRSVETHLAEHYGILLNSGKTAPRVDRQTLTLASLCHVLMNSNEFLFID